MTEEPVKKCDLCGVKECYYRFDFVDCVIDKESHMVELWFCLSCGGHMYAYYQYLQIKLKKLAQHASKKYVKYSEEELAKFGLDHSSAFILAKRKYFEKIEKIWSANQKKVKVEK